MPMFFWCSNLTSTALIACKQTRDGWTTKWLGLMVIFSGLRTSEGINFCIHVFLLGHLSYAWNWWGARLWYWFGTLYLHYFGGWALKAEIIMANSTTKLPSINAVPVWLWLLLQPAPGVTMSWYACRFKLGFTTFPSATWHRFSIMREAVWKAFVVAPHLMNIALQCFA